MTLKDLLSRCNIDISTVSKSLIGAFGFKTVNDEISNDNYYDARADLWSIGVIIYQLHFKSLPFPGKEAKEIYAKIKNKHKYKLLLRICMDIILILIIQF